MVSVIKKDIKFKNHWKIESKCNFFNIKPVIWTGSLRVVERTNLAYVEPHRIIIKEITFLAFNNETSIKDLEKRQITYFNI